MLPVISLQRQTANQWQQVHRISFWDLRHFDFRFRSVFLVFNLTRCRPVLHHASHRLTEDSDSETIAANALSKSPTVA